MGFLEELEERNRRKEEENIISQARWKKEAEERERERVRAYQLALESKKQFDESGLRELIAKLLI